MNVAVIAVAAAAVVLLVVVYVALQTVTSINVLEVIATVYLVSATGLLWALYRAWAWVVDDTARQQAKDRYLCPRCETVSWYSHDYVLVLVPLSLLVLAGIGGVGMLLRGRWQDR